MKPLTGKDLARIFETNSWQLTRIHGSHHIYAKEGRRERLSVPIHGNKPLKPGIQAFILKSAGIEVD